MQEVTDYERIGRMLEDVYNAAPPIFLTLRSARTGSAFDFGKGKRRTLPLVEVKLTHAGLLFARMSAIAGSVVRTLEENADTLDEAVRLLSTWMRKESPVRVLGAGRALLAAAMPGNRLAHAGAKVSFVGGVVPLPNSRSGGGIIACSASGKTESVLTWMSIAKKNSPRIQVLGIADAKAKVFAKLCDVFIGLKVPKREMPNPLSALADTEEYVISEILDGLVVAAGRQIGFDDDAWRRGHEDIGLTGPYAPQKKRRSRKRS